MSPGQVKIQHYGNAIQKAPNKKTEKIETGYGNPTPDGNAHPLRVSERFTERFPCASLLYNIS